MLSIFLLSILLSVASASAPGDEQFFCTDESTPVYPPSSRILMDSYNYINLLPPHDKAVWQQVDMMITSA